MDWMNRGPTACQPASQPASQPAIHTAAAAASASEESLGHTKLAPSSNGTEGGSHCPSDAGHRVQRLYRADMLAAVVVRVEKTTHRRLQAPVRTA